MEDRSLVSRSFGQPAVYLTHSNVIEVIHKKDEASIDMNNEKSEKHDNSTQGIGDEKRKICRYGTVRGFTSF